MKSVFIRNENNPVLAPNDMPPDVMYVLNPGAVKHNGEYVVMMDAAVASGPIVFWLARSKDGMKFTVDPEPVNWPGFEPGYTENCVYDPRITKIGEEYFIMYASASDEYGISLGLVKTKDFVSYERIEQERTHAPIRNGVLFPEKINGRYVRLDRPMDDPRGPSMMYLSYSDDLIHWRDSVPLMDVRPALWDRFKIGGGAVPIKTKKGWLTIYHGVGDTCNGLIYALGVCMLDLNDPEKIIARGEDAVLWPVELYELVGRVPNVVFTCNAIPEDDGSVKIYYGAADTCIGLAEAQLADLMDACYRKNRHIKKVFGKK
ncbi:MAG: glycoside hydrolase family 130 protein [Kiritimatiellales bacterium]